MRIGVCVAASAAALLSACATSEPHPWKRPLSLDQASTLGETRLSLVENNDGVVASWFAQDSSAAGAQYGLIGALVTATMDGMANGSPSDAAQRTADELARIASVDRINQGLSEQMKTASVVETYKVRFGDIVTTQKLGLDEKARAAPDDTIEFTVTYTLSQDATALKAIGNAVYSRADAKYATPYTFKTVPEEELGGPIYRNTFIYESNRVTPPPPTAEMKAAWAEQVRVSYMKRHGKLPVKGGSGYGAYQNDLAEANNDTMSAEEAGLVVAKGWTLNNGAALLTELNSAHAFFAKYLLLDLNSPAVPRLDGQDEILETLPDGRVVRLVGFGGGAGSYLSTPGNLTTTTTWGNAIQIAQVNRDRAHAIGEAAKARAKGN